ncbi:thioesterase superfamily protein, partial [mine drainage metagenome]
LNPDHVLLRDFLAGDGTPRPFDANPLARGLATQLLAADARQGSVTLGFMPGPQFLQGNGCVQGGIVAAMLDFALAVLTRLAPGQSHSTASFSVDLLRPTLVGSYIAQGRIQRLGSRLAFADASLALGDGGELVGTATGVMSLRQGPKRTQAASRR